MNVEEEKEYFVDVGGDNSKSRELEFSTQNSCGIDDYTHTSPNVSYVDCNVPGPECDMDDFEAQYAKGCNCLDGNCASEESCPCVSRYGQNYVDFCLLPGKFGGPVVECNSECSCAFEGKCANSLVQRGPRKFLEIFSTSNGKGLGLQTNSKIPIGGFICEYAGEVIGEEEARRRAQRTTSRQMNYIFVLKEHLSGGTVIKTCVDPTMIGNIGRYINHSCRPNAAVVPVRVDCPVPRLGIFAVRDIEAGEEITFDYGGEVGDSKPGPATSVCRTPCCCSAESCRKYLPFDSALL
ncbi:histone-lysine N-methyltransferase SETMAR [Bacillus rossius redtenbacheri]|uniref:histone-lysine N-methyltransferase SETMAR n=1 Tax=Bacillus rossius redtenbacheri TaxID=93214 RepID=UPI002FDCA297